MYRFLSVSGLCLAVSACTTTPNAPTPADQRALVGITISHTECQGSARANCAFFNGPVQLQQAGIQLASRKATFFPTISQLDFVDARATRWVAPKATLTDGASIPNIFISAIGIPTSPEFLNASAMHDAYCGIGNENGARFHTESWQKVHRMYYDALRVSGTPSNKAKIMFTAVYLGGPRWASSLPQESSAVLSFQDGPTRRGNASGPARSLGEVSTSAMVAQLKSAIDFINKTNPSIAALELFLRNSEARAIYESAQNGENGGGPAPSSDDATPTHDIDPTTGGLSDPTLGGDILAITTP